MDSDAKFGPKDSDFWPPLELTIDDPTAPLSVLVTYEPWKGEAKLIFKGQDARWIIDAFRQGVVACQHDRAAIAARASGRFEAANYHAEMAHQFRCGFEPELFDYPGILSEVCFEALRRRRRAARK